MPDAAHNYAGLYGTREERQAFVHRLTNRQLFWHYSLACQHGEIEISLASEDDFNHEILLDEILKRLERIGFLPKD